MAKGNNDKKNAPLESAMQFQGGAIESSNDNFPIEKNKENKQSNMQNVSSGTATDGGESKTLPPLNIEKLINLAGRSDHFMRQEVVEKSIILLGNTRAGKSTLANGLIGKKLIAHEYHKNDPYPRIILADGQEGSKIGHSSVSETTTPHFWENQDVTYCDCPGFGDSKSEEQDIANAMFIQEVFAKSKTVKILLVTTQSELSSINPPILKFAETIVQLFPKLDFMLDSIGLIVTQVDKISGKRNSMEKPTVDYFAQKLDQIMTEHKNNHDSDKFKNNDALSKLFKIFAHKLAIFDVPSWDQFDNGEEITISKQIFHLVEGLKFTEARDVKAPYSGEAFRKIDNLYKHLYEEGKNNWDKITSNTHKYLNEKKLEESCDLIVRINEIFKIQNQFNASDEICAAYDSSMYALCAMLNINSKFFLNIFKLIKFISNISPASRDFKDYLYHNENVNELQKLVESKKNQIQSDFLKSFEQHIILSEGEIVKFVKQIKDIEHIKNIEHNLKQIDGDNFFDAYIQLKLHENSDLLKELCSNFVELCEKFSMQFPNVTLKMKLVESLKPLETAIAQDRASKEEQLKIEAQNHIAEMQSNLKAKEVEADLEKKRMDHEIEMSKIAAQERESKNRNEIEKLKLINQEAAAVREFQLKQEEAKIKKETEEKEARIKKEVEEKEIKLKKEAEEVEKRKLEEQEKNKARELQNQKDAEAKQKEITKLTQTYVDKLMKETHKEIKDSFVQFNNTCNNILIKAVSINFDQQMQKIQSSQYSFNAGNITNYIFYATSKIVIHESMNLEYPSGNLILVAPSVEFQGKFNIDLSGNNGQNKYGKAENGKWDSANGGGSNGKDGEHGTNGMNGGNFIMIAQKYERLDQFAVNVSGGNGGSGQNGGNGGGCNESYFWTPTYRDGGNGGKGGNAGHRGTAGYVEIFETTHNVSGLNIKKQDGHDGSVGSAGIGGKRWVGKTEAKDGAHGSPGCVNSSNQMYKINPKCVSEHYKNFMNGYVPAALLHPEDYHDITGKCNDYSSFLI